MSAALRRLPAITDPRTRHQIACLYWREKLNTFLIAQKLGLTEAEVYNYVIHNPRKRGVF